MITNFYLLLIRRRAVTKMPKVKITPKKGSKGKQKSNVVHAEGQGEGGRGVQARRSSRKKGTEEKLVEEGKKRKRTLTNDHTLEGSNVSKRRTLNRPTKKAAARNKDLSPSSSEEVSQRSAGSSAEGGKLEGRERRTRRREVGSGSSGETDMEVAGSLEERREKGGVKEVRVSAGTIAKWKPVSLATRKLLTDAMTSALGHCLDDVRGSNRRSTERAIQGIIRRVEEEVSSAKAPPAKRMKSCSDLKQRVAELKEKCIALVDKNQQLEQRVEERQLFIKEREQATDKILETAASYSSDRDHLTTEHPLMEGSDDEAFTHYMHDLVSCRPEWSPYNLPLLPPYMEGTPPN